MRISDLDNTTIGFLGAGGAAAVGGFGAYVISSIFSSVSPLGVALVCGVTTGIALAVLFSDENPGLKFLGFMAAYPLGVLVGNGVRSVRFLDPIGSVIVGGVLITPMAILAVFLTACSSL